ncbi:MAG: rhodanese-like domain-containing protein [Saprospiraceae bacterium]|nr:rhodanese-like domain-containing protein [Saprospiraceae bacterium]
MLSQFFSNLFSGSSEAVVDVENSTSHPSPKFDNLPGNLFKKELDSNPDSVLLDVRTAMEVSAGKLPGAMVIDFMASDFRQKVAALDKSKTYFVYCRSGNRSGSACQIMHKLGFDVRNLMGGIGAFPK